MGESEGKQPLIAARRAKGDIKGDGGGFLFGRRIEFMMQHAGQSHGGVKRDVQVFFWMKFSSLSPSSMKYREFEFMDLHVTPPMHRIE